LPGGLQTPSTPDRPHLRALRSNHLSGISTQIGGSGTQAVLAADNGQCWPVDEGIRQPLGWRCPSRHLIGNAIATSPHPAAVNPSLNHSGCCLTTEEFPRRTGRARPGPRCRTGSFTRWAALTTYHSVSSDFVTGGDRRAAHARPAGLARLRDAINSWLEETSFRTALTAFAAALLIVAAAATALLLSGPGTSGGPGTVAGAAPGDPAGTPATSAAAPASSPQPRAITVPSASPATPDPAPPSPAAIPPRSVTSPSPPTARSRPRCRHGHGRHHHC
jgi:hypothetical protein